VHRRACPRVGVSGAFRPAVRHAGMRRAAVLACFAVLTRRAQAAVFRAGQNVGVHPCCGASALRFDTAAARRPRHRNECCRRPHDVDATRAEQAATLALMERRRELVVAAARDDGGGDGSVSADTGDEEGDAEGEVEDEEADEDPAAAAAARARRRPGPHDARAGYGGGGGGQRRKPASAVAAIYAPGLINRARAGGGRAGGGGGGGGGGGVGGGGIGGEVGKDGAKPARQWNTELLRACPAVPARPRALHVRALRALERGGRRAEAACALRGRSADSPRLHVLLKRRLA
jgi:uncharacterized membrane protein YgcG